MAFTNLSFEDPGDEPGCAAGWTFACHAQQEYAIFSELSWEAFEDWVEGYKFGFTGIGADLVRALFDDVEQPVEDFSNEWSGMEVFQLDIIGVAAIFDTGAGTDDFESFEGDWDSNESYKYAFVGPGTDLTVGAFDGTPENYEDFEEDWVTGYLTAFVGVGTDLTVGAFDDTPEDYEDFEEDWTLAMVSI